MMCVVACEVVEVVGVGVVFAIDTAVVWTSVVSIETAEIVVVCTSETTTEVVVSTLSPSMC